MEAPFVYCYAVALKWKDNSESCWEEFDWTTSPQECERITADARPKLREGYEFRFYKMKNPKVES